MSVEEVQENIRQRDELDYTWDSPTSEKAPDAKELNTTYLTIDQQIETVLGRAKELMR